MNSPTDITILLVEDDEVDVRAVQRSLRQSKITNPLIVASDGVEALQLLRGDSGKEQIHWPYLILLDLNMPRMNGFEFLKAIREDPKLKMAIVFVMTTSDDDRDLAAAYEANIAGYILKSKAGDDFLDVIRMVKDFTITVQFPPAPSV